MSVGELGRAALAALGAHKLRSFLTLLGVIIGVGTVVSVAGVISGLNSFVRQRIINLAPDVFVVTKFGIIRSREEFIDALKRPDFTPRDVRLLERSLLHSDALAADTTTTAPVKFRDRRLADTTVYGCSTNYAALLRKDIEAGSWFAASDERAAQAVAVIGWDVKDQLFQRQDPIGRTFTIGGVPFRVVGVMAQQGSLFGMTEDTHVYVPLSTFGKTWGSRGSLDILVRARGGVAGLGAAMDEVRAVLRASRHTPFRSPDPFGLITASTLQDLWRQVSAAAFLLTFLIASVSLGVGGIVIMNIMLVGVVERTREIGVRLAVGARKRDIRRQFLLESSLLSTLGGIAGVALGGAVVLVVRGRLGFPAELTLAIVALGLGLAIVVGVAAGYWPARAASNLAVVDALRDET